MSVLPWFEQRSRAKNAVGGRSFRVALWLLVSVVVGAACGGGNGDLAGAGAEVRAVTSLEIFADMVREVGGDRVEVTALLPSGADPHTFELSPGKVADIARADIVFLNGLNLEGNLQDIVEENAGGAVVLLTEGLNTLDGNPHLWLDVSETVQYVEAILNALIEVDANGRMQYEANAAIYLGELESLDQELEAAVDAIPEENRKLVTFHNAFQYLASRYGLEVVAVVAESPGQEPSARDIAELVEALEGGGVPAVFKEPQFSSDVLVQAAGDVGVRVLDLLSDAYTEDVGSYVELMRFNMAQLQEGLGGG